MSTEAENDATGILNPNLLDGIQLDDRRRIEEKRIKEWLNEDGTTRTLVEGLCLLHNVLGLLLKRRTEEKRIKEWLNKDECTTHTLVVGLYLLRNGLCLPPLL